MTGIVTEDGQPIVELVVANQNWPALIDTGFNGDVEFPDSLRPLVNVRFIFRAVSRLAAGQTIEEDVFEVQFPFDGEIISSEATFVSGREILIGTHLLRRHVLNIDFPNRVTLLDRAP